MAAQPMTQTDSHRYGRSPASGSAAGAATLTKRGGEPARPSADLTRLEARGVSLAYDRRVVSEGLSLKIPDGSFTVIVGPNACGKSTALRALARMLKPTAGSVLLDGAAIASLPAKQVARTLGLLPQSSTVPDGITVRDLVGRGRFPHQGLLRSWSQADEDAVQAALAATRVTELEQRFVDELSGGQRQRVWLAMVLAQETELLLLDEPTTYLDIAHQLEVLDLCAELREERGRTLVAVLHDLNQAARYATHLIAMKDGAIVAEGHPSEIVTPDLVDEVFGLACLVVPDPATGTPLVVPRGRNERGAGAPSDG
jgi:iron complex transport system ATP-binding protein